MADEHNRTRYLRGCRCDVCKEANSAYKKELRQRKNAENAKVAKAPRKSPSNVRSISEAPKGTAQAPEEPAEPVYGPVESAIRAQLGALSTVETRRGEAEVAFALARVLDNGKALPQHSAAAHRLSEIVDKLSKGAAKKTSKLALVSQMTQGDVAAG